MVDSDPNTVRISGQFKPGLRNNIGDWMRNPVSFLVPPKRQIQEDMPASLGGVLSTGQWNQLRDNVENAFEPLQRRLMFWHPLGNIAAVVGPAVLLFHIVTFVIPLATGGKQHDAHEDEEGFTGIGWMLRRMWPFLLFAFCMVLKAFVVPRIVRSMQPEAYANLERVLSDLTNAHPGWTFTLTHSPHYVRSKHGQKFSHNEVSITFSNEVAAPQVVGATVVGTVIATGPTEPVVVPAEAVVVLPAAGAQV